MPVVDQAGLTGPRCWTGCLIGQREVGPGLRVMVLAPPPGFAGGEPGQFVHVAVGPGMLRRPFSLYRAAPDRIELLYRVKGTGTRIMASWRDGAPVSFLGPLGTSFAPPGGRERVLLVGGGIGVAPLACFAERFPERGVALLGFRTAAEICGADRIAKSGYALELATEDGSAGARGRVTAPLAAGWPGERVDRVLTCGPWPMMAAVARWAAAAGLPCHAALEREMGCGVGACLGCVYETTSDERPYARACTEGPVVDAKEVRWRI